MNQLFCVFNSNATNLYGDRFTVGALVSGTYDACLLGVPSLVEHDRSRPIGWSFPSTVYMEPGLARVAGFAWLTETNEEVEQLNKRYSYHYHKTCIEPNEAQFEKLQKHLTSFFAGEELKIGCECVAFYEPGLARRVFPQLFGLQDKDGLVPLNHLTPIGSGIYQVGNLVVFAHQFFRRNLYRFNSLNYPLLSKLEDLALKDGNVRLALDNDMVGLADSFKGEMMELEYWWGPKFNDDLTSIPIGVTHHRAGESELALSGISGMQFRWGKDKNHHIFEAEELRNVPSPTDSSTTYGCRYVHSMVDTESGKAIHLDGAIRSYFEEKMIRRLEINLDQAPRDTDYTKLWRVDGQISVVLWKSLLSDYYRGNHLVGEYFGGIDDTIQQGETRRERQQKTLKEEYIPYSMSKGSGVRVALTYKSGFETAETRSHRVITLDKISDQNNAWNYVENCGLELKKALKKQGIDLAIQEDVRYVSFKDAYINFPLIYHDGPNTESSLQETLIAIKKLVDAWIRKGLDMIICYSISFPVDAERVAVISVLGHANDLSIWLSSKICLPPTSHESLHDWAEKVANYLSKTFVTPVDIPPLRDILMPTGVLLINRRRVDFDQLNFQTSDTEMEYSWEMRLSESDAEKASELESAGIVPCLGILVEKSRCTKCGSDYQCCGCSKTLDDEVAQEICKMVPFFFWTDRPLPVRRD